MAHNVIMPKSGMAMEEGTIVRWLKAVGDVVTLDVPPKGRVTWCYVTDPEGNIIELQSWSDESAEARSA